MNTAYYGYNCSIVIDSDSSFSEVDSLVQVAMVIVDVMSLVGTIGNALVIYVFVGQKQQRTSTIFILTLACTDFVTSLVTVPYTIAIERLKFKVQYDVVRYTNFY